MYTSNNIAEQIKITAKNKGVTVKQLLEAVNLGKNTMTNFKTSMPKADNLARIADYLGCSVDYLLGRSEKVCGGNSNNSISGNNNIIGNNSQIKLETELSSQEKEVLLSFRNLSELDKAKVLLFISELNEDI